MPQAVKHDALPEKKCVNFVFLAPLSPKQIQTQIQNTVGDFESPEISEPKYPPYKRMLNLPRYGKFCKYR